MGDLLIQKDEVRCQDWQSHTQTFYVVAFVKLHVARRTARTSPSGPVFEAREVLHNARSPAQP